MKKLINILFVLASLTTFAQVHISLNVSSHPTPQISEWENRNEVAILTVTNTDPNMEGRSYKIEAEIYLDNRLIAETRTQDMPIMQLPLGSANYFADQIIPYSALSIHENQGERASIIRTGLLPAGNYRFCVKLVDLDGITISTPQKVCQQMILTDYQMPELILPFNQQQIQPANVQNVIFRWTPISPNPPAQDGIKYLLSVAEVSNGQTPQQAFLSNHPIIEQELVGVNQYYLMMGNVNLSNTASNASKQYVWSVKALRLNDTPYFTNNNGFAPFYTFTVLPDTTQQGNGTDTTQANASNPMQDVNKKFRAGSNGEFEVNVNRWRIDNHKYTGEGTVYVDWLKSNVKVAFENIELDSINRLKSGKVYAQFRQTAPDYPKIWTKRNRKSWTNKAIDELNNWVKSNPLHIYSYKGTTQNPFFTAPGIVNIDHENMIITEMIFSSSSSRVKMVASKSLPPSWGLKPFGYYAWKINFHPSGLAEPNIYLRLVEDVVIKEGGKDKVELKFKKSEGKKIDGSYLKISQDTISFQTVASAKLPLAWLSLPDKKSNTEISLTGVYKNWNDMILTGKLPSSLIPDTEGVKIEADEISFDLSDVSNTDKMTFPSGYPNQNKHFMGFFAKKIEVEVPKAWSKKDKKPISFSAKNMIIDKNGISMQINAKDIVSIKDGKVADLSGSIEHFFLEIKLNRLTEAWVKGKLVLPISDNQKKNNYLKYKALFHLAKDSTETSNFLFTVQPGIINVEMLEGKMDLANTSVISLSVYPKKFVSKINLNGKFYWESKEDKDKKDAEKKNWLQINFQDVGLNIDTSIKKKPFTFNAGTWSFASPQKKVKKFPVTIKRIYYHQQIPTNSQQVLNGELRFDAAFNLSKDISGKTTFGLQGGIKKTADGYEPEFGGLGISKISVDAKTPTVKIKGSLDFFANDYIYGDGFKSEINVFFTPIKLGADALVQFGNTNYLNNNNRFYRYWRVEAKVVLPPPGVPFLPGFAFRGFGGGAYYNMKPIEKKESGKKVIVFKPKEGDWGLKALAVLATTPKDEVFNADIGIKADITKHDGIKKVGFFGQFYIGAGLNKRSDAHAKGKVNVDYDFPKEHFNMAANFDLNLKLVKSTNSNFEMDIDGKKGDWSVKLGEPSNMNIVRLFPKNINISVGEYLMVGNKIPTPTGFSNKYKTAYKEALGKEPGFKSNMGVTNQKAALGKGFSFGVNFMFNTKGDTLFKKVVVLGYYPGVGYHIGAGAEMFGSLMEYKGGCAGYNPVGMNGWRAQAGLSVYGNVGLKGLIYRKKDNKKIFDFTLADVRMGAWVQGEFPKPTYAEGEFQGKFKILFFDFDFNQDFKYGKQCKSLKTDNGVKIKQQNVVNNLSKNKLIEYVYPKNKFNGLPVDEPIVVKYNFRPNEIFSLAEQQADGSVKNRTFRLKTKAVLRVDKYGSLQNVEMISSINNLGEVEYRPKNTQNSSNGIGEAVDGTTGNNTGNFAESFANGAVYPPQYSSATPNVPAQASYGNGSPVNQAGNMYRSAGHGPIMLQDRRQIAKMYQAMQSQMIFENISQKPKWESNKDYVFVVEAELQELTSDRKWKTINTKLHEKKTISFRTEFVQAYSVNFNEN